ncbi:hypothetical protein Poli38472_004563 [Pythium oligandrum]|uniref:CASTOR ACT domain-containing protein n=1 Tax=Pythium oligandrum TaxID=41045 RepID=A0A8K1CAJ0_PYTOL|nr:hypothetical protein Poli38472_004563 [Pythium oligandrum]|eukprot:TMW59494.1 hypothetical protein Poli38472_004563 [Pythium oligandrum]
MDIVTTSNFHATLLKGQVNVVFIAAEHLRRCSWPLLNLLLYGGCDFDEEGCRNEDQGHVCRSVQAEIFSVVSDRDGMTLFMDPNGVQMFNSANMEEMINVAPNVWRAIQIHLGPMVAEFPGVISFLSKLLAAENISILNMSTYDTDIIYVQEPDVEAAISCLQSKLSRGVHGLKEAKEAERSLCDMGIMDSDAMGPSSSIVDADQYLIVYPESLIQLRLQKEGLRENAYGLTRLVLLAASHHGEGEECSFWCYCETAEEISLFMNERFLTDFTEDSVIVSPDRWRAIKLGGRTYRFDETGVVAAMSGFNTDQQVLNVSSFGSNVTFVLEDALSESVDTLCESLKISHVKR